MSDIKICLHIKDPSRIFYVLVIISLLFQSMCLQTGRSHMNMNKYNPWQWINSSTPHSWAQTWTHACLLCSASTRSSQSLQNATMVYSDLAKQKWLQSIWRVTFDGSFRNKPNITKRIRILIVDRAPYGSLELALVPDQLCPWHSPLNPQLCLSSQQWKSSREAKEVSACSD